MKDIWGPRRASGQAEVEEVVPPTKREALLWDGLPARYKAFEEILQAIKDDLTPGFILSRPIQLLCRGVLALEAALRP